MKRLPPGGCDTDLCLWSRPVLRSQRPTRPRDRVADRSRCSQSFLQPQQPAELALATVLFLSLSACAVGPNYTRPPIQTPAVYRGAEAPFDGKSLADLPWWEVFRDPTLKALIEEALASNYDTRIAAARVEQARYAVGVTRADLMPQANYTDSAERTRAFLSTGNQTGNVFLGAFQMAWEIDVWGRIRRATEASLADLFVTEDVRRGVVLTVITDVAQAYFELRELDLELEIAEHTRDSFQQTLDLFTRQLLGGIGNKLAVSRAEAALADAAGTIPELENQIVAKENQLSILLGRQPGEIARGAALIDQPQVPDVPAGLPSALLERSGRAMGRPIRRGDRGGSGRQHSRAAKRTTGNARGYRGGMFRAVSTRDDSESLCNTNVASLRDRLRLALR
jgi:hypothetical protein